MALDRYNYTPMRNRCVTYATNPGFMSLTKKVRGGFLHIRGQRPVFVEITPSASLAPFVAGMLGDWILHPLKWREPLIARCMLVPATRHIVLHADLHATGWSSNYNARPGDTEFDRDHRLWTYVGAMP